MFWLTLFHFSLTYLDLWLPFWKTEIISFFEKWTIGSLALLNEHIYIRVTIRLWLSDDNRNIKKCLSKDKWTLILTFIIVYPRPVARRLDEVIYSIKVVHCITFYSRFYAIFTLRATVPKQNKNIHSHRTLDACPLLLRSSLSDWPSRDCLLLLFRLSRCITGNVRQVLATPGSEGGRDGRSSVIM